MLDVGGDEGRQRALDDEYLVSPACITILRHIKLQRLEIPAIGKVDLHGDVLDWNVAVGVRARRTLVVFLKYRDAPRVFLTRIQAMLW